MLIVATSASAALAWLADLEFPGMRIVINERSAPPALPESAEFVLGERVSLAEARGTAGFELEIPAELGEPDEVYVHAGPGGTFVTFVYAPRPGLPEAEETGVGALLYQFVSPGGLVGITKSLGPATVMRWTDVHGADALWLEGAQVSILTWIPAGTLTTSGRPSAHVLIWQAGGVTYRLETVLGTEEAVRIAESLSPLPADAAAIRP